MNFGDIYTQSWDNSYDLLLNACESLKKSGADGIALCTNTAHLYADRLQQDINLPIIHIVTETAKTVSKKELKKIRLLGTKFTMEMDFYRNKLELFGLEVLVPEKLETREYIQYTLREELGIGFINPETKKKYKEIVKDLLDKGAECIVPGCTEIPILVSQDDFEIPVFDTTNSFTSDCGIYNFLTNKRQQPTEVLQKSGFSAKLNICVFNAASSQSPKPLYGI